MSKGGEGSFWDHIEDLRQTLISCILCVAICFAACLFFHQSAFQLLRSPLNKLHTRSLERSRSSLETIRNTSMDSQSLLLKEGEDLIQASEGSSLQNHRLLLPAGAHATIRKSTPMGGQLYLLGPTEGLLTTLHVCLWLGLALSSPLWMFFVLKFVAPGLKDAEQRVILPFIALSMLAFAAGFAFALKGSIPLANTVLSQFNDSLGENLWTVQNYIHYSSVLMLGTGVAFEIAVIVFFLAHCGRITAQSMRRLRRPVVVFIFILAAVMTPPDVITQVMLAVPLMGLYEAAIVYAALRARALAAKVDRLEPT